MNNNFNSLNKNIIKCNKCPRLVKFRKKISKEKRRQYIDEIYCHNFKTTDLMILIIGCN